MNTWMISTQNSNTPILDMMIFFHDSTMMIVILITMMIFYIMMAMSLNQLTNRFLLQGHMIELIWTISPAFILIMIAIPSIKILYLTNDIHSPSLSMKAVGHQWYWSYEYSDFINIEFDSFMIPSQSLNKNEFRLLDVDARVILPFNTSTRILTTSMDVIHSWTVPSLGIKMDSTPSRLNQTTLFMYRPGIFYGQCSEICGTNHSFMPIVIESTNLQNFKKWLYNF